MIDNSWLEALSALSMISVNTTVAAAIALKTAACYKHENTAPKRYADSIHSFFP